MITSGLRHQSGPQDEALLGYDSAGPSVRRLGRNLVHECIVVTGVVMKYHQGLDSGGIGETHALLPGRMSPVSVRRIFGVGIGGVIDHHIGAVDQLGYLVSTSLIRELGPVLTGILVAGRNASGMPSELGSMVVTEQIDAMRALGTDPMKKLVTPRVISTVFMLFFLTILSDLVGLAGGLMVSKLLLNLDARQYWSNAWQSLVFEDVFMGLVKPVLFGFIIATVGCFYGITARGGTQGVGRATTQAVVAASVLIIVVNFFVTQFLMNVLSYK